MNYWLVKSEPYKYSIDDLKEHGTDHWDGVRNYQARNNMRAMKKGDLVLFYHSNEGKDIVGIAKVAKEAYPDHTSDQVDKDGNPRWSMVDLKYLKKLKKPITLAEVKEDPFFKEMNLVTRMRLSVQSVQKKYFDRILKMSDTKI